MSLLTHSQKQFFYQNGYIKLAKTATEKQLNVALRSINYSLGKGMDPRRVPEYQASSYTPELLGKDAVTDLHYKTHLWSLAESLLGKGKVKLLGGGQVALRFPVMTKPSGLAPHIDGLYREGNNVRKGSIGSFSLLAGVFLSRIPNEFWGNFTVWPGSHHALAEYFRKNGWQTLREGLPKIKLGSPIQLTGEAGDAILCHYQTAHTVVSNVSPYIRYAVFFRLIHVDHAAHRTEVFTDLWKEWPGMKDVIRQ